MKFRKKICIIRFYISDSTWIKYFDAQYDLSFFAILIAIDETDLNNGDYEVTSGRLSNDDLIVDGLSQSYIRDDYLNLSCRCKDPNIPAKFISMRWLINDKEVCYSYQSVRKIIKMT